MRRSNVRGLRYRFPEVEKAAAVVAEANALVTFDQSQAALAEAEGLRVTP